MKMLCLLVALAAVWTVSVCETEESIRPTAPAPAPAPTEERRESANPPQILKDILFTPDLKSGSGIASQDGKLIIANPKINEKPLLSPHSPSARAMVLPDEPAQSVHLERKLEESIVRIKEAVKQASPALIAAASGEASKVKLEAKDNAEKPSEEGSKNKGYAEVIGQFITQLLEIPIVLIGAFREVVSGLTGTKVSIQVSQPQHMPTQSVE